MLYENSPFSALEKLETGQFSSHSKSYSHHLYSRWWLWWFRDDDLPDFEVFGFHRLSLWSLWLSLSFVCNSRPLRTSVVPISWPGLSPCPVSAASAVLSYPPGLSCDPARIPSPIVGGPRDPERKTNCLLNTAGCICKITFSCNILG